MPPLAFDHRQDGLLAVVVNDVGDEHDGLPTPGGRLVAFAGVVERQPVWRCWHDGFDGELIGHGVTDYPHYHR